MQLLPSDEYRLLQKKKKNQEEKVSAIFETLLSMMQEITVFLLKII